MLYVVATPIGNLEDITIRAIETLKNADLIAAEDTRKTGILLKRYEIETRMVSYHDHNEKRMADRLVSQMKDGLNLALVSDAGTPLVSDPGYRLIQSCVAEGVEVTSLPGPSSVLNAMACSGLAVHTFCFEGFLPRKPGQRERVIREASEYDGSTVFFESPHRIHKTIGLIAQVSPECRVCIGREMTKIHEEFIRGSATEVVELIAERSFKGEITLVLEGIAVDNKKLKERKKGEKYEKQ